MVGPAVVADGPLMPHRGLLTVTGSGRRSVYRGGRPPIRYYSAVASTGCPGALKPAFSASCEVANQTSAIVAS